MKQRSPRMSDQEQTQRAFEILMRVVQDHPEVEPSLWVGACISAIATAFHDSESSYGQFKQEMHQAVEFYRRYWE